MSSLKSFVKLIIRLLQQFCKLIGLRDKFNLLEKELTTDAYNSQYSGTYDLCNKIILKPQFTQKNELIGKLFKNDFNIKIDSLVLRNVDEQFILLLKKGIVAASNGAIITRDGFLLRDLSREFANRFLHSITQKGVIPAASSLNGTAAVLVTAGTNTYYHWLVDILPRLAMIQEVQLDKKVNYYVVAELKYAFQKDSLKLLGISEDQLMIINHLNNAYQADELVVPSLPSRLGMVSEYAIQFLRKSFITENLFKKPIFERIYISRKKANNRKLLNEPAITDFLEQQGFQVVFPEEFSFQEQVQMFYSAKFIIAPHGSGMTNIVFCNNDVRILEVFSSDFFVPCYMDLATQLSFEYHFLFSDGSDHFPLKPYWDGLNDDFTIPIQEFKKKFFEINNTIKI